MERENFRSLAVSFCVCLLATAHCTSAAAARPQEHSIVTEVVAYDLAQDPTGDHVSLCETFSDYAKNVMTARQEGASIARLIKIVNSPDPEDGGVMQQIVIDAYDHPKLSLEENKREAIKDFENEIYIQCIKASAKK